MLATSYTSIGYNVYEKYGGFDYVFEHYYKKVAHEYISPVAATADLVIEKGENIAIIINAHKQVLPSSNARFLVKYGQVLRITLC